MTCKRRSFFRAGRKVSEITSGETTSLRVHCARRVYGRVEIAPTHAQPTDRSNARITKGAWFPRGCVLHSVKKGSGRRTGEGGGGNGGGGEKGGRGGRKKRRK